MINTLEKLLEWGGLKRDVAFLVLGGASLLVSIFCRGSCPSTLPGRRWCSAACPSSWKPSWGW